MPPGAEQRRADTQMSGTVRDGSFEIAAHSGRDYGRRRVPLPDAVGNVAEPRERRHRVSAERRHGHHALEFEARVGHNRVGEGRHIGWSSATPAWATDLIEVDLDQTIDTHLLLLGGLAESFDEAKPIDRVHEARVRDHRRALVRLQGTYEMPPQEGCGAGRHQLADLGHLGSGFLVATLSDVDDPERGEG